MSANEPGGGDLPVEVRGKIELFCHQLRDGLGDQLTSIVLYGGLAKGEYIPFSSDVNMMVVLKAVTIETLDRLVAPVQQGLRDFHLAVMVLSEHDLQTSTDAFPVKFLDMQQYHRVLWGKDVLADLVIAEDHLRLRCEQEIKNLLLRLRQFYLRRAHPEAIEAILTRSVSSFLTSLGVALRLKTGRAPTDKKAVAEAAGRELGLDRNVLQNLLALKAGTYKPEAAELKRLYGSFMTTVQEASEIVDRL